MTLLHVTLFYFVKKGLKKIYNSLTRVTKINAIFNITVRNVDKRCSHMLMPARKYFLKK